MFNKMKELPNDNIRSWFDKLTEKYNVYAPVNIPAGGRYQGIDAVQYKNVDSFEKIVFDKRSDYPMKEVITPITQTLYTFMGDDYREVPLENQKDYLIFARACDINSVKIQDQIYLENGNFEDLFYSRVREKIHFALIECTNEFDGCFCVSTNTNKVDDKDIAFKIAIRDGKVFINANEDFSQDLEQLNDSSIEFTYPEENELKVNFPEFKGIEEVNELKNHPMWDEYQSRCIHCGSCTTACSTCTCFDTRDMVYNINHHVGERRRTEASCMIASFDEVAGGAHFRKSTKDRYRYKILHKIYAHNARFKTGAMCVGCGRCSAHCPQLISYPETINKVSKALEEIRDREV
ncbi:MAG: anaerobic sulfite reductase subunit AsrA [Peptoniphilaceae bacterium]|nr:anaerobic sulfite reductase subunit AsrA [Peptoniphilaceae bacterium]MDY3738549.1 anaerobic sulfite reductase subunit AsrA [Peptoniphilaceae bacterium]